MRQRYSQPAFTLAELLIALAILGVIATFTIPKILDSGSDSKFNSIAKEAIGMVSGAYQSHKLANGTSTSTSMSDFTPYMNYVNADSTTTIDHIYTSTTIDCSNASHVCLRLHNGAMLRYVLTTPTFANSSATSAINFFIDPDGKVTTTGAVGTPGKSLEVYLYYNGRTTSRDSILPNTYLDSNGPYNPNTANNPDWFSWSN